MRILSIISFFPLIFVISWVVGMDQLLVFPITICLILLTFLKFGNFGLSIGNIEKNVFLVLFLTGFCSLYLVTNYGIWIKYQLTFLCAWLYIGCIYSLRERTSKLEVIETIHKAAHILSLIIIFSFLIFIIKSDFKFTTVLGPLFPTDSHFFESMRVHSLSSIEVDYESMNSARFSGIFISYSAMSMGSILLMGIVSSNNKLSPQYRMLLSTALLIISFATQSRLGLVSSLLIYITIIYQYSLKHLLKKIGVKYSLFFIVLFAAAIITALYDFLVMLVQRLVFDVRANSAHTRFRIYEASIQGILEHPFFGLGQSNPIDFSSQRFSAGTHSSYIAIGYQRGLIALFFYALFMLSFFIKSIKLMWKSNNKNITILSITFIGFFLREAMDTWWWDSLLFFLFLNFIILFKLEMENE